MTTSTFVLPSTTAEIIAQPFSFYRAVEAELKTLLRHRTDLFIGLEMQGIDDTEFPSDDEVPAQDNLPFIDIWYFDEEGNIETEVPDARGTLYMQLILPRQVDGTNVLNDLCLEVKDEMYDTTSQVMYANESDVLLRVAGGIDALMFRS